METKLYDFPLEMFDATGKRRVFWCREEFAAEGAAYFETPPVQQAPAPEIDPETAPEPDAPKRGRPKKVSD